MNKYLTLEGLEKLKKELEYLKKDGRKKIAERLKNAISFGDLSENADYEEAKEAQGFLEGRILELKEIIASAKIIEKGKSSNISIGSTVLLSSKGIKEKYQIVGSEEADILSGKISYQSPLGKVIFGKKKGESVIAKTPGGNIKYQILEIN
ncbi:transcription elongation factor GreA [Patescibacteria group bacterium]